MNEIAYSDITDDKKRQNKMAKARMKRWLSLCENINESEADKKFRKLVEE